MTSSNKWLSRPDVGNAIVDDDGNEVSGIGRKLYIINCCKLFPSYILAVPCMTCISRSGVSRSPLLLSVLLGWVTLIENNKHL